MVWKSSAIGRFWLFLNAQFLSIHSFISAHLRGFFTMRYEIHDSAMDVDPIYSRSMPSMLMSIALIVTAKSLLFNEALHFVAVCVKYLNVAGWTVRALRASFDIAALSFRSTGRRYDVVLINSALGSGGSF